MLDDEHTAVHSHYLMTRKGFLQLLQRLAVLFVLAVCRHEDGMVDDEEIGMSGWQSLSLVVAARVGQREREEFVGLSVFRAERFEFLLHQGQLFIVLIRRFVTLDIGYRVF